MNDMKDYTYCMQNRELSWLKFNERVLDEASVEATPLMERLKYIAIFTSNLDEFYMIRVGSLVDNMLFAPQYIDNKTGMSAEEQLREVFARTAPLYKLRDKAFHEVMSELKGRGVDYLRPEAPGPGDHDFLGKIFERDIKPFLSPQIVDNRHPFPHLDNEHIYIAVTIREKPDKQEKTGKGEKSSKSSSGKTKFGIIALPPGVDRVIRLPGDGIRFMLLEDVLYHFAERIFQVSELDEKTVVKVTRNADINTEEGLLDEDVDYLEHMKKVIKKRPRLSPVRLSVQYPISARFAEFLCGKLGLWKEQVFTGDSPLDLSFGFALEEALGEALGEAQKAGLLWGPHVPEDLLAGHRDVDMLGLVRRKDILFYYPFESMNPFLSLVKHASEDPAALSIKITLYRIDKRSRLAETLIQAAENGKEVIVLMEVRARFDENNNIEWAQRLEEAGCRVIYGQAGFKVHSKICLITRKEQGKIEYVTHIGTGNFNEKTAKLYTDLSLITVDPEIGLEAVAFFNNLMLGNLFGEYSHFWVSPYAFKNNVIAAVGREMDKAKAGQEGRVIIKCNSLTDRDVIMKLIDASRSGVKVDLIVRGICCIRPRIPDYTENISDISIVGRFLEHSRIFRFGSGEDSSVYISSADLMTRNTERRVEIACPVRDPDLKDRLCSILDVILSDNIKAREQSADGSYALRSPGDGESVNSQEAFMVMGARWAEDTLAAIEGAGAEAGGQRGGKLNLFARLFNRLFHKKV